MNSLFISKMYCTQIFGVNAENYPLTDGHEGLDLVPENRVDFGVHIPKGFNNGKVIYDGDTEGKTYGCQVKVLFYEQRVILQFCHLSENTVRESDIVNAGDLIGIMGDTGHSFGCHVHFNSMPIDKKGNYLSNDIKEIYKDPGLVLKDPWYWTKH